MAFSLVALTAVGSLFVCFCSCRYGMRLRAALTQAGTPVPVDPSAHYTSLSLFKSCDDHIGRFMFEMLMFKINL